MTAMHVHVHDPIGSRPPDSTDRAQFAVLRSVPWSDSPPHRTSGSATPLVCIALRLAVDAGVADISSVIMLSDRTSVSSADAGAVDAALVADCLQLQLDEGPSLTALRDDTMIAVPDLTAELRWPGWTAAALDSGISALLIMPISASDASLNFYFRRPRMLDDRLATQARSIADHAGSLLRAARVEANLQRAITTRTVIGQAQGILIERYRVTPAMAFQMLRVYSQHHNVKVARLAEEVVASGEFQPVE